MKQYVVIKTCCDEEWMLGIYDDYEKAYGAVLLDAVNHLNDLNASINQGEAPFRMTIDSRPDSVGGCYMEISATYSETSANVEYTDIWRVFFNKDVLEERE